ncbi:MAG: RidA family protein [Sphingomonadales bacterium]
MNKIFTENASKPGGHYSQAVEHNGLIFVSGQLGVEPGERSGDPIPGTIEEQVIICLKSVDEILKAAGSGIENVLKMTIYVTDSALWPEVNKIYSEVLGEHKPARAIVPCKDLHFGFNVEIEAIAATV